MAGAALITACGGDGSGIPEVAVVSDADTTDADTVDPADADPADADPADVDPADDQRADLVEFEAEVLSLWEPDEGQVWSLAVTDEVALVIVQQGFDSTLTSIDLETGQMASEAQTAWIAQFAHTASNGVFVFDNDECTFRSVDPQTLELGDGFGDLRSDGCSGGSDSSIVRGDVIWNEQRGVTRVIDTSTGEVRSLEATEISERLDDIPSHAFLDLGDAVMIIYFGDDATLASRVEDDLTFGPLVEVPRRPYFDNGLLVDDAMDDDGFIDVVVLDPFTLEATDAPRPPIPQFGTVSCDPLDALRSYPAPDASVWVGPLAVEGEIVVAQCRDGVEVGRGAIDHDQFRLVEATADAFFYSASVYADPDDDGTTSFEPIGQVLVRVSAP